MKPEFFKKIVDYPDYEVSNYGTVRSWKNNKWNRASHPKRLKPCISKYGYKSLALLLNGKQKTRTIHSLVAETFIGGKSKGLIVCHNDGDKLNNYFENLRYGTYKDNAKDAIKHGHTTTGIKNARAKLNEKEVISIRVFAEMGFSQKENSFIHGVSVSTVSMIVNRKIWKHI